MEWRQDKKVVSGGWSGDKKVLVRRVKRMNWLIKTNVRSEILRRVCTGGLICNGGKSETYSAVNS